MRREPRLRSRKSTIMSRSLSADMIFRIVAERTNSIPETLLADGANTFDQFVGRQILQICPSQPLEKQRNQATKAPMRVPYHISHLEYDLNPFKLRERSLPTGRRTVRRRITTRQKPASGGSPVINIRNTSSSHWRGWLKPENRSSVPSIASLKRCGAEPRDEKKGCDLIRAQQESLR